MEEILSGPMNYAFLFINMKEERFLDCFSKYEMTAGLEVIERVVAKKNVPCYSVETEADTEKYMNFSSLSGEGPSDIPVQSAYDTQFIEKFREMGRIVPEPLKTGFFDVFSFDELTRRLKERGIAKVILCGFDSEKEIIASVIGAVREHFIPVILSDCISSRSERVFFEVLNVLSRWAVIGDTRDMIKLWSLW